MKIAVSKVTTDGDHPPRPVKSKELIMKNVIRTIACSLPLAMACTVYA
jgi:hypothetical protein